MRVLWFSVTPSLFNPRTNCHNGGGWIASLEQIIRGDDSIELGVAFEFDDALFKHEVNGVSYYPIKSEKQTFKDKVLGVNWDEKNILKCLSIIDDFKPDLIQIFGSENYFGLLCKYTEIPIVIHMQGCLPPYYNALFPIGINKYDFLLTRGIPWRMRLMGLRSDVSFRKRVQREISIIKSCRYFMGRTDWDKGLVSLFNEDSIYFHCEEALRNLFNKNSERWRYNEGKVRIMSVISSPWYKGVDLILKTAKILKEFTSIDFEWNVYGVNDIKFYEKKYKIRSEDVNVKIEGTVDQVELVKNLKSSSCYVHPSYIENSPNSLCEAQIIGIPLIATHVGGVSSLVENGETGLLVPANDPYMLAVLIRKVVDDSCFSNYLSARERMVAQSRHNPDHIRLQVINIYQQILRNGQRVI